MLIKSQLPPRKERGRKRNDFEFAEHCKTQVCAAAVSACLMREKKQKRAKRTRQGIKGVLARMLWQ